MKTVETGKSLAAFLFDTIGAKKKSEQKKNAEDVSPSADGDKGSALDPQTFEKV